MRHIIVFISLLTSTLSFAQSKEIGIHIGASNYHGDLAQNVVLGESHFSGGLFYRHNFNQYWAWKPSISIMHISGTDQNFEEYRLRNLSFYSDLYEVSNVIEFNYLPYSKQVFHQNKTFYTFLGIAAFYFNPKAQINGTEYELHAINTENLESDDKYKRFQIAIPFGVGYKYAFNKNLLIGCEVGWRKTFTDYLDDVSGYYPDLEELQEVAGANSRLLSDRSWEVSETKMQVYEFGDQRGDPSLLDWYMQASITISYRFTPIRCWAN